MAERGIKFLASDGVDHPFDHTGDSPHVIAKSALADGTLVNVQNPISVDGDSVYCKDVDQDNSSLGDFSGSSCDLFDALYSTITNSTSDNPKIFTIMFNRTIDTDYIGIGALTSGNFSNVKLQFIDGSGTVRYTHDDSANATKYTSRKYVIPPTQFDGIVFNFLTADPVSISNIVIKKITNVAARLQALKPDGTVTDIDATAGGNLKVSLEELESGISVNNNSQLKITQYSSAGNEYCIDQTSSVQCAITYAHNEIHAGNHFFSKDWEDLANGATIDLLIHQPDVAKWAHFIFHLRAEAEFEMTIYRDVTTSSDGTPLTVVNRNENSTTANNLLCYKNPTITDLGTLAYRAKGGSGKAIGGDVREEEEQVIKQNSKYLARITNSTTSNNWVSWKMDWYEHENI